MLSQGKLSPRISKFDRERLEAPITVRVIFRKTGNLQYFSHLDLQRTWQRVLVRASIPMWYTQGFNPHSKIVFGVPLPVGVEGMEEMVDLRIDRRITCEEIRRQLNAELTEEMQVSEVYVPTTAFSEIAWAAYEITLQVPGDPAALAAEMQVMLAPGAPPIIMTKRSKSGDKEVDILPLIHSVKATVDGAGCIHLRAVLRAGNSENLNPEYLIKALRERLGILPEEGDAADGWYRILRIGFYGEAGVLSGRWFR